VNELLRRFLLQTGLREDDVAARLGVDPKTVRRWLNGRVPTRITVPRSPICWARRKATSGLVLTAPLSGHQVVINGHALCPPFFIARGRDLRRPGSRSRCSARSEVRMKDLSPEQASAHPG
jgi:transcriptional regulator with XRE-family HTH domain